MTLAEHRASRTVGASHVSAFPATGFRDEIFDCDGFNHRLVASCQVQELPVSVQAVRPDVPLPKTFLSNERHSSVMPQDLSERWMIGLDQAHHTLKKTTQFLVRTAVLPLSRRYKADDFPTPTTSGGMGKLP